MTEPVEETYPSNGEFVLKHKTVDAMQYNGTPARAHEILAWVYQNGGSGSYAIEKGYSTIDHAKLFIGQAPPKICEDDFWVCTAPGKEFSVVSDERFREQFEPVRTAQASFYGAGGGGQMTQKGYPNL